MLRLVGEVIGAGTTALIFLFCGFIALCLFVKDDSHR